MNGRRNVPAQAYRTRRVWAGFSVKIPTALSVPVAVG